MSPWKAAHPGDAFEDIDTPALVLDLDAFERKSPTAHREAETAKAHRG